MDWVFVTTQVYNKDATPHMIQNYTHSGQYNLEQLSKGNHFRLDHLSLRCCEGCLHVGSTPLPHHLLLRQVIGSVVLR